MRSLTAAGREGGWAARWRRTAAALMTVCVLGAMQVTADALTRRPADLDEATEQLTVRVAHELADEMEADRSSADPCPGRAVCGADGVCRCRRGYAAGRLDAEPSVTEPLVIVDYYAPEATASSGAAGPPRP